MTIGALHHSVNNSEMLDNTYLFLEHRYQILSLKYIRLNEFYCQSYN